MDLAKSCHKLREALDDVRHARFTGSAQSLDCVQKLIEAAGKVLYEAELELLAQSAKETIN